MKINPEMRFPHPVLSHYTNDFCNGEFDISVTAIEESFSRAELTISYSVKLTEPTLVDYINKGSASVGVFVYCGDSYCSKVISLSLLPGKISFAPGALIGRVEMTPAIWSTRDINDFPLEGCHPEFGHGSMPVCNGTILALGDVIPINVGRDKLQQVESIFKIVRAPQLPSGTLDVNLDDAYIKVMVADDIHSPLCRIRNSPQGRAVAINSIFLPAVMEVLNELRGGGGEHEGKRWHRIFKAKCDYLGINLTSPDVWRDAQRILGDPFKKIVQTWEDAR